MSAKSEEEYERIFDRVKRALNRISIAECWSLPFERKREMFRYMRDYATNSLAQLEGAEDRLSGRAPASAASPLVIGTSATCAVCHRRKKPRGRSAPMEMTMCDHECPGYSQDPQVGQLWPGETSEDFGYPVTPHGSDRIQGEIGIFEDAAIRTPYGGVIPKGKS